MRGPICSLSLVFSCSAVAAGPDAELARLHSALDLLNQEQVAIYQQFQMIQDLRRSTYPPSYGALMPVPSGEIANYDEAIAAQNRIARRNEELSQEAFRLVTRYGEIEAEKKPLQQQILRLTNDSE
jgi:hypothetical protein